MGSRLGDVRLFEWLAPVYDHLALSADATALVTALSHAEYDVEFVLDVAGGTGRTLRALATAGLVLDAAPKMLSQARRAGLETAIGDAATLPIRSETVDAVTITDALHHVADERRTLQEAARVLRPGGVLVVQEFDPATVPGRALVLGERLVGFDSTFYEPVTLARYVEETGLRAQLVESGFQYTVVGVKPANQDRTTERDEPTVREDR